GSKGRPPMLAPDTEVPIFEGSPDTRTESQMETYKIVSQDIRDQLNAEAEAVQIILTGIDNDIYSIVDAFYNPQTHPTRYTQNSSTRSQQTATRNRGKAIVNSPQPIYDQEPSMVAEDDETSKDKEIDKPMALISLSFKKIYKPTNNNLRTSSNTSQANHNNSPRINRSTRYENQRIGNVARARETVGNVRNQNGKRMLLCKQEDAKIQLNAEQADWRDDTNDDELEYQELEAPYMYMAQLQEVSPDAADSGPIFDDEPLQKVSNDDHYNVFAIESEHPEQSESAHDTYPIEHDGHNVIINSLDMSYDREEIDQNDDDDDLANKRELLASLIEKLKCEIDESKKRNKFLETSNKVLIEKLKEMKNKLSAHQETISILSQQKETQIKLYKTRKDKELDKVISLENNVKVLDNIVYKTGQSVQTMNMLNNKCPMSFVKPEFLKKAQRANPHMYDIGCYNDNLALMLTPESDDVIRLENESRSKLSDLIRPFDYDKLNNLYDLLVP
nr:hypothetical protein [Tanacetum cinerariifolium]